MILPPLVFLAYQYFRFVQILKDRLSPVRVDFYEVAPQGHVDVLGLHLEEDLRVKIDASGTTNF